jgi:DNA polymerase
MERHCCTQAASLATGLPAKLKNVAKALNLQHQKDEAGERLMHQTCKPRKPRKDEDPNGIFWFEDDDRLARLGRYCVQDVRVERELHSRIPMLSTFEHRLWLLHNKINDRGFHVDGSLPRPGAKSQTPLCPRSTQNSPRSPTAPSRASIKSQR